MRKIPVASDRFDQLTIRRSPEIKQLDNSLGIRAMQMSDNFDHFPTTLKVRNPVPLQTMLRTFFFALFTVVSSFAAAKAADAPESSHPDKTLPLPGTVFRVEGAVAFVLSPQSATATVPTPWVWYAPTLPGLPGAEERWMFEQFLSAGIAIAGIDVGDSHGSPSGRQLFSAFYVEMTEQRTFSPQPVLLGRSRGGLQTLNWAAENPTKVAAFAGVYPVCNLESWPGLENASGAYRMTVEDLRHHLAVHNPISRLEGLAKAGVPMFAIHGDEDDVVPLESHFAELTRRYRAQGGQSQLLVAPHQGHNMWPGFFQCQELVDFVIRHSRTP